MIELELQLLLLICDWKKNYQKAFELLTKYTKLYKRVQDFLWRQAHYLILLNRHAEAKQIYETLLVEHHEDNWEFWVKFLDCLSADSGELTQDAIIEARTVLQKLASYAEEKKLPPQRLIYLAEIELNFRINNQHPTPGKPKSQRNSTVIKKSNFLKFCVMPSDNLQAVEDSCVKFFQRLMSRLSTYRDLMFYLNRVPREVFSRVTERFSELLPKADTV
jgi:tetratricopeptide (TPR) repeat protein